MARFAGWALALCVLFVSTGAHAREFVPPWLTGESRPEDLTISLATFGPGDEVHQYFGHTALEVRDRRLGTSALYNFGMFGFDQAFLVKFLKGHLEFWLGVQPTQLSYDFYADQDRDVRILELDLTPGAAAQMARDLAVHALPENRTYLYHHYYDNCATRIVDAIDKATNGAFKASLQGPARLTFRGHTRRYAARDSLIDWLLVFAMNDSMEAPIKRVNELFLPEELEAAVAGFQYQGKPLVRRRVVLHKAGVTREVYEVPPTTWPYTLGIGLAIGAVFALLGRAYSETRARGLRITYGLLSALFGLVFGVLGLLVTVLALFTEHKVTTYNENLFFASPLLLLLVVSGIGLVGDARWAGRLTLRVWVVSAGLCVLGVLLKVFPNFDQDTTLVWTLLLPIQVLGCLGYALGVRQTKAVTAPASLATPSA